MIQWVVERLVGLLGPISRLQAEKREIADAALTAISHALDETRLYYRDIESGQPSDQEREAQLVRAWSAAAIPMRHIDRELASACQHKSDFWLNPESWEPDRIEKIGISLDDVSRRYKAKICDDD